MHELARDASSFVIIKDDRVHREEPCGATRPEMLLSSPDKVQLVRLDKDGVAVVWDRQDGADPAGEVMYVSWSPTAAFLSTVLKHTASSAVASLLPAHDVVKHWHSTANG
jgi:hypothetical protein